MNFPDKPRMCTYYCLCPWSESIIDHYSTLNKTTNL